MTELCDTQPLIDENPIKIEHEANEETANVIKRENTDQIKNGSHDDQFKAGEEDTCDKVETSPKEELADLRLARFFFFISSNGIS